MTDRTFSDSESDARDLDDDFADVGVQLAYGMRPNGRLVHITKVEANGLECGCVCPGCGARLVARKNGEARRKDGEVRAPHFAHYAVGACTGAIESMLHRLAKQVIADRLEVMLPMALSTYGNRILERPSRMHFDEVRLEHWLDPIRPDIVARAGDRELIVEIYVRHECPPEKRKLLSDRRLAAIEIDLSAMPRDLEGEALERMILEEAPRLWLWNRFIADADAQYEAEKARRAAEAAMHHEQAIVDVIRELREAAAMDVVPKSPWGEPVDFRSMVLAAERSGLAEFTGIQVVGGHCFATPPKVWQSAIIQMMVDAPEGFWPTGTERVLRGLSSHLKERFAWRVSRLDHVSWDEVSAREPSLRAPAAVVDDYLEGLRFQIFDPLIARDSAGLWMPDPVFMLRARERLASKSAPDRRRAELDMAVRDVLATIHRRRPGDLSYRFGPTASWAGGFEAQAWMETPLPAFERSPADLARAGGPRFGDLLTRLHELWLLRFHDADVPDGSLLGLPLEQAVAGRQALQVAARSRLGEFDAKVAAAEQSRRLERANQEKRAAARRLDRITIAAYNAYGLDGGAAWLSGPCSTLDGQSAADSQGWMSDKQEAAILEMLEHERVRRVAAEDARQTLERKAMEVFRNADRVALWMRGTRADLLGQRPFDACLEPGGMLRCKAILESLRKPSAGRVPAGGRRSGRY